MGSLVSGAIWKSLGPVPTFRLMAVWVFIGFVIFVVSDQYLKRYRVLHPLKEEDFEANEKDAEESLLDSDDELPVDSSSLPESEFQSLNLFHDSSSDVEA